MILSRVLWKKSDELEIFNQEKDWKLVFELDWTYKNNENNDFSSQNTILNDVIMYHVVTFFMIETNRNRFYSLNFSSKEYSNSKSKDQKTSAKAMHKDIQIWHYVVICENTQLHKDEEEAIKIKRTFVIKRIVEITSYLEVICVIQEASSESVIELMTASTQSLFDIILKKTLNSSFFDVFKKILDLSFFAFTFLESSSFMFSFNFTSINKINSTISLSIALLSALSISLSWNLAEISS
jgi:hypothetical protein